MSMLAIIIPAIPVLFVLWIGRAEVTIDAARAEVDQ
jgi:hypothetical protein